MRAQRPLFGRSTQLKLELFGKLKNFVCASETEEMKKAQRTGEEMK